ncbi:uncharacterized protein LAESUDRAFT_645833 [Laetiporus sulphureus 93-53]|uniref:Uncharacterized protein n=1 Tax=Laetiporus sulphureus 93-53 TaxID=1314785 RepID=A0A165G7W1_9APHY|nr:uncharacterized protein LAESUDRAFT_645833 [Laetiporus sulphureus 93-53]KZT09949.1 hypothetical protein LAESUDRAFT_645833 [Laetiporus sulphureus 93-53]
MVGSNASSFTQPTPESQEAIQMRAERMQQIVSDAAASRITNDSAIQRLQEIGANDQEVRDYLDQLVDQEREKLGGERAGGSGEREPSPSQSTEGRGERVEESQCEANPADKLAWAIVKQKLLSLRQPRGQVANEDLLLEDLAKVLGRSSEDKAATGIPQSVLAAAPHLASILPSSQDTHLAETFRLRQLYATEHASDPILDLMQQQGLQVPLPRSIWKDILLDRYVNFEKLFASMELGYDHDDEPKDLAAGFAIIKKDHSSSRRPVRFESDWIRIFGAWADGVRCLYPHRSNELDQYRTIILELFHSMASDPSIAIGVDRAARDAYYKSPFHLDDRARLQVHIFAEIMRSTSHTALGKRSSAGLSAAPSKRAATPCINWNLERCNDDHCTNRRKHGVCCECGGQHRVKDDSACFAAFKARKAPGSGGSGRGGSGSSART